ncbi:MAG: hypothetical protein V4547_20440 [Bacteroidota bacterium]
MKKTRTLLIGLSTLLFLTNCQTNSSNEQSTAPINSADMEVVKPLTEQELKEQLLQKECSNSTKYLDGTLKYEPKYKNALSLKVKGLKIVCKITNKATLATFKDIGAHIEFISKTGAKIFERDIDIYEFIAPNGSLTYNSEFEITNQQYKDIFKFNWRITKATCK